MKDSIPRSPFSTRFSGSAKETELRIRNIFQWQKQRPPVWLMALALLVILACGGLVSCQSGPPQPELAMDVQYYDIYDNYIEIPALSLPDGQKANEAITAINQALASLKAEYQPILDGAAGDSYGQEGSSNRCVLYPTEDSRYLNLVLFRAHFTGFEAGHIQSFVYDKETGRQVTMEEALELAGLTEEALLDDLAVQMDPQYAQDPIYSNLHIESPALDAFRLRADGTPVFYLSAQAVDRDAPSDVDYHLFIWEEGVFTLWNPYLIDGPALVPAEETVQLDPPLWCQWHSAGGEPEGGFVNPANAGLSETEQALLGLLYQSAQDSLYPDTGFPVKQRLLAAQSGAGWTLGAAAFDDTYGTTLCVGVMDDQNQTLISAAFCAAKQVGAPHVAAFEKDGACYLLYTNNELGQGYTYGDAGLIQCDGTGLTWVWPVKGDIRDETSQAYRDYHDYWEGHKALLTPGGVEIFAETGDYGPYEGSPVQWMPETSQLFYSAPEDALPIGTRWNVRAWLEDFTRDQCNPWNAVNTSALWRILSLTPGEAQGDTREYRLLAAADSDDNRYLTAVLQISGDSGTVTQVLDWTQGTLEEVTAYSFPALQAEEAEFLPIPEDQPLEMMFCSGAGGWSTVITLDRDGSFEGTYSDSEMGSTGAGYHGTVYLCSFRGRFQDFRQLSGHAYSMTLQELEITTSHPVGEEWIEDQIRYISSDPYGLDGGTEFLFYTPETPISELSQDFLSWYGGPHGFPDVEETGTLSYYGLYNKSTGYGFFS